MRDWITSRLNEFLQQPLPHYERRGWNDLESLCQQARKGDVLLVEGDLRISAVIRYLTQSSWSHAALYVGDELLRRGGELRERTLEAFGEANARHLVVEALVDGVVVSPLRKYADLNVRICRPIGLQPTDLALIVDDAVKAIGWRYDLRNVLDLARHLVAVSLLGRASGESARMALGSRRATEVMCTSLLGRLFHRVGFPVLPAVTSPDGAPPRLETGRSSLGTWIRRRRDPYPAVFRRRHPTLLQPRDFDLSPYFEIVKFNHSFDYQRIEWADDASDEVA